MNGCDDADGGGEDEGECYKAPVGPYDLGSVVVGATVVAALYLCTSLVEGGWEVSRLVNRLAVPP